ncbi:MAG: DUF432 domain-containing protein, partial [Nitrospirae bacterium]
FGPYTAPFEVKEDGFVLSCEAVEGGLIFKRQGPEDDEKELLILSKDVGFLVNPIEPVNLPKKLTHYLYIELQRKVVLAPKERTVFYIKFPVEVSVFVSKKKGQWDSIDIFTLAPQKYTLYGEITSGCLCRYYSSDVFYTMPEVEFLKEGVLLVDAKNSTNEWVAVTRLVFDAHHMKIYYGSEKVSMQAQVEVTSEMVAETSFKDRPLKKGMKKSLELYLTRKIPVLTDSFVMEWGY